MRLPDFLRNLFGRDEASSFGDTQVFEHASALIRGGADGETLSLFCAGTGVSREALAKYEITVVNGKNKKTRSLSEFAADNASPSAMRWFMANGLRPEDVTLRKEHWQRAVGEPERVPALEELCSRLSRGNGNTPSEKTMEEMVFAFCDNWRSGFSPGVMRLALDMRGRGWADMIVSMAQRTEISGVTEHGAEKAKPARRI